MNDGEIIKQKLIDGDPNAFERIFEKYYRKVFAFFMLNYKNKEDAEESVQDVFYTLWKDRQKLKEINDIEAWIFAICFNVIRKYYRRLALKKKHMQAFSEHFLDRDDSTAIDIEYNDLLEKTDILLQNLPPRQRTIFLLSRKNSMSNLEISKKLNISLRTVDNQLSRAKTFLKGALNN